MEKTNDCINALYIFFGNVCDEMHGVYRMVLVGSYGANLGQLPYFFSLKDIRLSGNYEN